MFRSVYTLHLAGMAMAMGGLLSQLVLLSKSANSPVAAERTKGERMAGTTLVWIQAPGVMLSIATGLALAWMDDWSPFQEGWLQFKLLFFFWILMATRLMSINTSSMRTLRGQCGEDDSDRLKALKDNHRMIGYVTVATFLFVIAFSIWRPL